MINKELLQRRKTELTAQISALQSTHDRMVKEHNARVKEVQDLYAQNQARYQQLTGALNEVNELLNEINQPNGSDQAPEPEFKHEPRTRKHSNPRA